MKRGGARLAAFAVLALLVPGRAGAVELKLLDQPLLLNFTEYGATAYHVDNGNIVKPGGLGYDPTGSGYADWLNRFQLDGSWGNFTALLRLDSDLFFNAPQAAPTDPLFKSLVDRYGQRLDLEKVAAGYTSRHLEVTLGDSYVTYGRGLVLALRKEDELGVDTTLRGASVTGHVAGLNANAVAGVTNILNVDTGTGREADDPDDVILGSRVEYRFGKYVVPGADVAFIRYAPTASNASTHQTTHDSVTAYSATLELPYLWDHGTVFMEYARQAQHFDDFDLDPPPTAFYGSATGYWGPVTLLVEYKNYRHYTPIHTSLDPSKVPELALTDFYNAPPTLERINQAVLDNADVTGPHARLDVTINPNITPYVSMADFTDRILTVDIYDPYAGLELHWQDGRSRAAFSGGRRISRENELAKKRDGLLFQDTTHLEFDVNQWLTGPYSIELDGNHQRHHDRNFSIINVWTEGQSYLSFKRAELFSVAAGFEYYTEFPNTDASHYLNVSASWNITHAVLVRLFAGGQRAGIKCVNGVCRNYPGFDGGRAEVLAKF